MRIALISQEYPPETAKGGIGAQTWAKAHGLAALGHEIHVISRSPHGQGWSERRDSSIHIIRVPGWENRMSLFTEIADWISYSAEVAASLARLHQGHPLDLIDFPEWAAEGYVHFLNRTQWNHVPTVVQLHGPLVMFANTMGWPDKDSEFYRIGSQMERTCLRLADAVYSSSVCSAEWCERAYGLDAASIPVIHTGVDTELFCPGKEPKHPNLTIVFVGKLVPNKGVYQLVDAACRLAREFPELRLELIGRGEEKVVGELKKLATAAGCPGLLHIPGPVQRENLPADLGRAHVFAAPSQYEGGPGFVYLEAMACGLPVIACSGSGAAEVIRDGANGLLVPPGDVEALVTALRSLLGDATLRNRMAQAGREYAISETDTCVCIRKLERFYTGVVDRFGRSEASSPTTAAQSSSVASPAASALLEP